MNGDLQVGAPSCRQEHNTMASCQNPLIPRMAWIAPPRGLLGRGTRQACREHANDTATHVELPEKKMWYSESASSRRDSVALHRRRYGMRGTVEHVPMVLRMVSRLGPGTTVDALVQLCTCDTWGAVVTVVLSLRSSPTHAIEALRHEHDHDLLELKGIAVWILNVLVDATRHHGETETADQNSGLVDLH